MSDNRKKCDGLEKCYAQINLQADDNRHIHMCAKCLEVLYYLRDIKMSEEIKRLFGDRPKFLRLWFEYPEDDK